mgnify:CR=1 FL=1
MPKHNIKSGFINYCQICGTKKIKSVLNLGHQPLADDLKDTKSNNVGTNFFPIIIGFCKECILLQNNYIVDDKSLYSKNYHYRPGITKDVVNNFGTMSQKLVKLYNLNSKHIVADIGCNDGSLLKQFRKLGIKKTIGIEPTDTIRFAKPEIKTVQDFMNVSSSKKALKFYGKTDLITTTNVFAHTNNLKSFILGVKKLIKKDGIFVIENHYLGAILKKKQFDSFYHEHLRTYSLTSLIKLMKYYGFKIVNAYTTERYGGNIQAHFTLGNLKKSQNVKLILNKEKKNKLNKEKTYKKLKKDIEIIDNKISNFIKKNKHKKIVAKAFPARASILVHRFTSIKNNISFVAEQPSSLKLNKYVPGTNIKIISSEKFKTFKPDIMIVLAWHLFDTIHKKWKAKLKKTKFVKILPQFKVY